MKDKFSRRPKRPPWHKPFMKKRIILEKAVSALRCKGRTASIAFVSTNADFHHKGTLALMTKMLVGVRVSGGHLCEAEAPTEATAETFPNPLKSAILPRIKS